MGNQHDNTTEASAAQMTPAQIAASLTEAMVRALRDPEGCHLSDELELICFEDDHLHINALYLVGYPSAPTPLGRAVLAVLDGGK